MGRKVAFKMVCLKSFSTAFMRQINEGVRIACCQADICMNSKAEFHQPSIVTNTLGNSNEEPPACTPGRSRQRGQEGGQGRGRGGAGRGPVIGGGGRQEDN